MIDGMFGNPDYIVYAKAAAEPEPESGEYRVTGYVTVEMRVRSFVEAPVDSTDEEIIERALAELDIEGTVVSESMTVEREDDRGRIQSLKHLRALELERLAAWNAGKPIATEARP